MAQELVLIPKLKYEHLVTKCKNNDKEYMQTSQQPMDSCINLQTSQNSHVDSQYGGQISTDKKLYVKRLSHVFENNSNKRLPTNKTETFSVCKNHSIMEDINFEELEKKYRIEKNELQQEIKSLKRNLECEGNRENKRRKNIENNRFKCGICEKTYKNKRDLNKHVLSHSTFFTCDLCGAKFRRKDVLRQHIQRKHNQKGGRIQKNLKTYLALLRHEHSI